MKNKKGFLLAEETLKIIVSVIAITFLIYFLTSLYNINQDNRDLELAQTSLEHLIEEVKAESSSVDIYNPKGWSILSWVEGNNPRSCSNFDWEKCICMCEYPWIKGENRFLKKCDDVGYCLEAENISISDYININEVPLKLNIVYDEEGKADITRG